MTPFALPGERRSAVDERLALRSEGADWVEALLVACSPSLRGELRSIHPERAPGSRDEEAGARSWSHVLPDSNDESVSTRR
jgi:transposase